MTELHGPRCIQVELRLFVRYAGAMQLLISQADMQINPTQHVS
jgi:hypothetical protein